MTTADGHVSADAEPRAASLALPALGAVVGLLGAAWWAFDADPTRGKVLLVVGVILAFAGRSIGHRVGPRGQRVVFVIVSVAALLVLVDAVHLIAVVDDQRAAHTG